jgi:histidinol phosphatase-like enzyme
MILLAMFDFRLDPARCAIVGDKMSDVEAGLRILLDARADRGRNQVLGHEMVANLGEALELLRSRFAPAASSSRSAGT